MMQMRQFVAHNQLSRVVPQHVFRQVDCRNQSG